MPRILALDPGERRVGLALSDPMGVIASPHGTLVYRDDAKLLRDMLEVIRSRDVGLVVVGFPVREDGYEGAGCRRSRRMQELLDRAGIPAVLWDETGTTREALEVTRRHGLSHRRSRGARDSIAASLILSSYLAAQDQAPRAGRG